MSSNDVRARTLERALRAGINRDRTVIERLCTDDVRAWTPALSTASASELMEELDRRDESFSDIELEVAPLDVGGDHACVEWSVAMTHTGTLTLAGDMSIEPTGIRVTVHGITVAEFDGDRICSLRQYWDELEVLDQLGVLPSREGHGPDPRHVALG
jgi:ketosteroid isomerase-like protein